MSEKHAEPSRREELLKYTNPVDRPKKGDPDYHKFNRKQGQINKKIKAGKAAAGGLVDFIFGGINHSFLKDFDPSVAVLNQKGYTPLHTFSLSQWEQDEGKRVILDYMATHYPDLLLAAPDSLALLIWAGSVAMPRYMAFSIMKQLTDQGKTVHDLPDAYVNAVDLRGKVPGPARSYQDEPEKDPDQNSLFDAPEVKPEPKPKEEPKKEEPKKEARPAVKRKAKRKVKK